MGRSKAPVAFGIDLGDVLARSYARFFCSSKGGSCVLDNPILSRTHARTKLLYQTDYHYRARYHD
jgi:hypothetical protein